MDHLLALKHTEDALIFTAYVLPIRDAIWWGCLCAWEHVRLKPPEVEAKAFRAVLRWMQESSEATRYAARQASRKAGLQTPAGCMAEAAFCSRGSISPKGKPVVEAPAGLSARIVLAGVRLAATRENPGEPASCFHRYVQMAGEPLRRVSGHRSAAAPTSESSEGSIASHWSEAEMPRKKPDSDGGHKHR